MNEIYALQDPRTVEARYVGVTIVGYLTRYAQHLQEARDSASQTHKSRWIRSLLSAGLKPNIVLLEVTEDRSRELFWIAHFRQLGCRLTNLTEGGEGTPGYQHTEQAKLAMSLAKAGVPHKPEHVERRVKPLRGRKHSQERRDKVSRALSGKPKTGAGAKGQPKSESHSRALSTTWKEKWADPEYANRVKPSIAQVGKSNIGRKRTFTQSHKDKLRESALARWAGLKEGTCNTL